MHARIQCAATEKADRMKSSWSIGDDIPDQCKEVLQWDRAEIDHPNKFTAVRLHHLDRIKKVISIIKKNFPNASQTKVGEFGAAQGNISLPLAERGYEVYAVDINPAFAEYSKRKYEKGNIQWITGNIESLEFPFPSLDVAILGEILTTCAYPLGIVEKVMGYVRPGGIIIITVPNGLRIKMPLPTWEQVQQNGMQKTLEQNQFGSDHIFKISLFSAKKVFVPRTAIIVEAAYCGSTYLINRYTKNVVELLSLELIDSLTQILSHLPFIKQKTFHSLCIVLQKQ
jgi:2-polyprenyl-3-methyl-5-hydroxy-6-metoxy-1,4-benzoquinol methylase